MNSVRPSLSSPLRRLTRLDARHVAGVGVLALRPLRLQDDLQVLHRWVSHERAAYWGMVGMSPEQVRSGYEAICAADHVQVLMGLHDGEPAFLVETYHPSGEPVGRLAPCTDTDRGMHVLVAPPARRIPGFTDAVFLRILEVLFADPVVERVVVEPDIRNEAIRRRNLRAGFVEHGPLDLPAHGPAPAKTAMLSTCTRASFRAVRQARHAAELAEVVGGHPAQGQARHLQPAIWERVNRALVAKCLAEFTHERLLAPTRETQGLLRVQADDAAVAWRFRARTFPLEHLVVEPSSVERLVDGRPVGEVDAQRFLVDMRGQLGLEGEHLAAYLEEIGATLLGDAIRVRTQRLGAAELATGTFQDVETSMTQGHPCFAANNARIGFDIGERARFAPDAASPVQILWLAARRERTCFAAVEGVEPTRFYREQLGDSLVDHFEGVLRARSLSPEAYHYVPVHPWQWANRLPTVFADDLARQDLVFLGAGPDCYQPQQSIRTLFNMTHPTRPYVKMALSILNMGFMRGLSPHYMEGTPAINQWVDELVSSDACLQAHGFSILQEFASVGYRKPVFEEVVAKASPYHKMLASLWRESPMARVVPGQVPVTMASLLHVDREGRSFLAELLRAHDLDADAWVQAYLSTYLVPLLHCFFAHEMVFMPHGENAILVLQDGLPVHTFMKDIAEEVALFAPKADMPQGVRRIVVDVPEPIRILSLFTDVFDCFFRFLVPVLQDHCGYPAARFWERVADAVTGYQQARPDLAGRFEAHDMFAPTFALSCLNRLQLRNPRQLIDLADPSAALQFAGELDNPIAGFRPVDGGMASAGGRS